MMRVSLAALLTLLVGNVATGQDALDQRVRAALVRAGTNRPAIAGFLDRFEGEKAQAARFLVAWMPTVDLALLTERDLTENLELAFRARERTAYGPRVPFGIFLHYVLPHRATQERFEPHRRRFAEALLPLVGGWGEPAPDVVRHESMVDVALMVNRWCARRLKFQQTEFRDQSPNASERHGKGRCEELMIYCIQAMRAVGIPARPCSAPWWVVSDNNHAWVEVWADGAWHYLGACEPSPALGRTWFRGPAQRAGYVVSKRYGEEEAAPTGDVVSARTLGTASIDSTAVYARTQQATIELKDAAGAPLPDMPCAVHVWNFGALRALLTRRSDAEGRVRLWLGMGEYLFSAGDDAKRGFLIVRSQPGEPFRAELTLREGAEMPKRFWLRYPTPAEARRAFEASGRVRERAGHWKPELPPVERRRNFSEPSDPELAARLERFADPKPVRELLARSAGNWEELAHAMMATRQEHLPTLLGIGQGLAPLDLYEVTAQILRDHLRGVIAVDLSVPESEWILAPRIHREHVHAWRGVLRERFGEQLDRSPEELATWVEKELLPSLRDDPGSRLGPQQGPLSVLISGHATKTERSVFGVAVLRTLGVPARFEADTGAILWHDKTSWQRLGAAEAQARTEGAWRGRLLVERLRGGEPVQGARHLGVSRWIAGMWRPLRLRQASSDGAALVFDLPHGRYLVTSGQRNPNGDAFVQAREVVVGAKEHPRVRFVMDPPGDAGIFRFPIARKVDGLGSLRIGAKGPTLAELSQDRALLLFFDRASHEPSTRARASLRAAWPKLAALGVELHVVRESKGGPRIGPAKRGWVAPALFAELGIERDATGSKLPAVLLLDRGGKPLLWTEGYDPELQQLLESVSRQIREAK